MKNDVMQIAAERLYLTADRDQLVPEGDEAAATLYCAPGDNIPASASERFGLVDGKLKPRKAAKADEGSAPAPTQTQTPPAKAKPAKAAKAAPSTKEAPKPADKEAPPPADKGSGGGGADKEAQAAASKPPIDGGPVT